MVVRPSMTERDKRDAAVEELLSTEATYVSDMKVHCFRVSVVSRFLLSSVAFG